MEHKSEEDQTLWSEDLLLATVTHKKDDVWVILTVYHLKIVLGDRSLRNDDLTFCGLVKVNDIEVIEKVSIETTEHN